MWRHNRWAPIVCPNCAIPFHYEKKQWRRITLPVLISVAILLVVQFAGKHFLDKTEFLVLYGITYGLFLIASIWGLHTVFTKLKFERRGEK